MDEDDDRTGMSGRLRAAGAAVAVLIVAGIAGSLLGPDDIDATSVEGGEPTAETAVRTAEPRVTPTQGDVPTAESRVTAAVSRVPTWTHATVDLPADWLIPPETLMPNGPPEEFVASTAELPVGGDACAQVPEAAMERLGPTDALLMLQRLHPAEPDEPTIGTIEGWPAEHRNQTTVRDCPENGDRLDLYWFHTQYEATGYWVLAAFGPEATAQRRAEALFVLNSFRPRPVGSAAEPHPVTVPDVQGLALIDARASIVRAGLHADVASGRDWEDPNRSDAVVVAQEPPAAAIVDAGDVVGLRTAVISDALCAAMTRLPRSEGDATDLATSPGYRAMLAHARSEADGVLTDAITQLLRHGDHGQPLAQAPGRALDTVSLHHRACHHHLDTRPPAPSVAGGD